MTEAAQEERQIKYRRLIRSTKTLTGNDIALASFACALAIAWHKKGAHPRCKYTRNEIAKYKELCSKLQYLSMNAYPDEPDPDERRFDEGDEKIMKLDPVVLKTISKRRKVRRAQ